ncbi:hypothetical protein BZG36_00821 [Bifiguratus adelaidae]|uniref:Uncharacterized protein n=1 Tax=Bifiguratus adelaidae TaxID=1938954 RepID=A0A261Y6R3_9FUNG|nr:hypothetical protein BZG36_00821 [Bifiguratus adelaidae]
MRAIHTLPAHVGTVHALAYNKNGQYCLSGGQDRIIKLWNTSTGMLIKEYIAHGREVLGLAIAPDNSRFCSCGADKSVYNWDVGSGKTIRRFVGHYERVNCVDFNADATVIASGKCGSFDTTVRLWDCRSQNRAPIQILEEAKDSVMSLQLVGTDLVTGSADGKVRMYDIRMGKVVQDTIGHPATSVRFSHDRVCVLVSSLDSTIRLLDKDNGSLLNEFKGHKNIEYKIQSVLSNDDAHVLSGSESGGIHVWDLVDASKSRHVPAHKKMVLSMDYHPSDNAFVSGSVDGSIVIWSFEP